MFKDTPISCQIGFHRYVYIGQQRSSNNIDLLIKDIYVCKCCGRIDERKLWIGDFPEMVYDWKPSINELLNEKRFRKEKILKICSKLMK